MNTTTPIYCRLMQKRITRCTTNPPLSAVYPHTISHIELSAVRGSNLFILLSISSFPPVGFQEPSISFSYPLFLEPVDRGWSMYQGMNAWTVLN